MEFAVLLPVAIVAACIVEWVAHRLQYGQEAYHTLVRRTQKSYAEQKRLEAELLIIDNAKREEKSKKRLQVVEKETKLGMQRMQGAGLRAAIVNFMILALFYFNLNRSYGGASVGTLPFEPMWFFKSIIQRGLTDPGPNDCSFVFVLVLCNLGLRGCLQKFLGHVEPPGLPQTGLMALAQEAVDEAERKTMQ